MIPKVIHYCWFGRSALPELAIKCIDSWKRFLPEYEIKEWNEDNFDVNIIPYTAEAYKAKKYAFVSDYARFWILYHYGGLYFDTDVEVIKDMDNIINNGPFMGFENKEGVITKKGDFTNGVNPGLGIGSFSRSPIYKEILDSYNNNHFIKADGSYNLFTIVDRTTMILSRYGLSDTNSMQEVAGIFVYPWDFFCPIRTLDGKMCKTNNTVSIHHFAASWTSPVHRILRKIVLAIGGAKLKTFLAKYYK